MAALAVGAGRYGGAREVRAGIEAWREGETDIEFWRGRLTVLREDPDAVFPPEDHPPGFDPHGVSVAVVVMQTLARLASLLPGSRCAWLWRHRSTLEESARCPLSMAGVAAAALTDLGFTPAAGEMFYLLLRLPGAAAHAVEQSRSGHKTLPFPNLDLQPHQEFSHP